MSLVSASFGRTMPSMLIINTITHIQYQQGQNEVRPSSGSLYILPTHRLQSMGKNRSIGLNPLKGFDLLLYTIEVKWWVKDNEKNCFTCEWIWMIPNLNMGQKLALNFLKKILIYFHLQDILQLLNKWANVSYKMNSPMLYRGTALYLDKVTVFCKLLTTYTVNSVSQRECRDGLCFILPRIGVICYL